MVGILLAGNGFVAILEKLPVAPVTTIKGDRISGQKSAHDSGDRVHFIALKEYRGRTSFYYIQAFSMLYFRCRANLSPLLTALLTAGCLRAKRWASRLWRMPNSVFAQ